MFVRAKLAQTQPHLLKLRKFYFVKDPASETLYNPGMRQRPWFDFLILTIGLVLVACKPAASLLGSVTPAASVAPATFQPTPVSHSQESPPTFTPDRLMPVGSTPGRSGDPTPESVGVVSPGNPNGLPVGVCTPLAGIELAELPAIISSPYDPPPAGKEDRHHGVDFSFYRRGEQASIQGNGVQAILPGVVAMALQDSFPYGNVVIVESDPALIPAINLDALDIGLGESVYTLYAHLEESPLVSNGQDVTACQLLGAVGKSGNAGVAHLHLETRLGPSGISFDRMGYYLAKSTDQEKENYLRWRISGEFRHFDPLALLGLQNPP